MHAKNAMYAACSMSDPYFHSSFQCVIELFRSSMHQDAHEFLMFIISTISEDIEADHKKNLKEIEDNQHKPATLNGTATSNGNGIANGSVGAKSSTEEVSMTLSGGDEVRIKVNGADINTVSTSGGSTHGNGHLGGGGESIGDRSSIQSDNTIPKPKEKMWVQKLFEGQLTNEIKCLTCEKVTNSWCCNASRKFCLVRVRCSFGKRRSINLVGY